MKRVTINGTKLQSEEAVHAYLKEQLNLQGYHGSNLDALWDALSTHGDPLEIEFIHYEQIPEQLEDYGKRIIKVFEDAAEENPNILLRLL